MANNRTTVLFPLPLSPTRATILPAPMLRSTSSTACSVRRDHGGPTPKCLVIDSARSRSSSAGTARSFCHSNATHKASVYFFGGWVDAGAVVHGLWTAVGKAATGNSLPKVGGRPGDARQAAAHGLDRGKGFEKPRRIGVQRLGEDASC